LKKEFKKLFNHKIVKKNRCYLFCLKEVKSVDVEQQIMELELEKSRLNREKSMLVLNKSLFIYFCFLFIGVIGFLNGYVSKTLLNILIIMGLLVLVIGTIPYIQTMKFEEHNLERLANKLKRR